MRKGHFPFIYLKTTRWLNYFPLTKIFSVAERATNVSAPLLDEIFKRSRVTGVHVV
jgi:hypothetical protein